MSRQGVNVVYDKQLEWPLLKRNKDVVRHQKQGGIDRQGSTQKMNEGRRSTEHINLCYFISLLVTICIGTVQFGWSIGQWNSGWLPYAKSTGNLQGLDQNQNPVYFDSEVAKQTQVIVQTVTTLGSMLGALLAGLIAPLGRWKCLIICNVMIVIGSSFCLMYKTNFNMFVMGRFLFGMANGGFTCFCPKYISETSPKELSGPAGAMFQVACTFGIFIALAITYPFDVMESTSEQMEHLCYFLFATPIILSIVQVSLLVFVFNYDTPKTLKERGDETKLREVLQKIYKPYAVQEVMDSMVVVNDAKGSREEDTGYKSICCNPAYSQATFVGIMLAIFQQLTGINVIMYYSGTILTGLRMNASQVNALVGGVNFLTTLIGLVLLKYFGRKPLMFVGNLVMSICLFALGFCLLNNQNALSIVFIFTFIAFFEFSSGTIVWLYMAEILQDKAQSIATTLNWTITLLIAASVPLIVNMIGDANVGYIFIVHGVFTIAATVFIVLFMKETINCSSAEIQAMFARGKQMDEIEMKENEWDDLSIQIPEA